VAVVNGLIYAAGGWDASHLCSYVNLMEAYDTATNSWSARAPMPTARNAARAGVWNGKVYVVGGSTGCGPLTGANEVYDPSTNAWTTRAPMPTPRQGLGLGIIDGVIYAVGGNAGTRLEAYDIASNAWSVKAPMLVSRFGPAVAVANGRLYVFGGADYALNGGASTASVESYDPTTNTWTLRAPMPVARVDGAAVGSNGLIYVMGGSTTNAALASVVAYDPVANTWSTVTPMQTARISLGAAAVNNTVYAIGGYNGDAYTPSSHFTSVEALTPGLGNKTFGDPDFTLSATASSGLAVSFAADGA